MPIPALVTELIQRFERNRDAYRSGQYNETQVRREFIDPMFKALGWDMDNEQGYAEAYKDVVHEDAIKVGGATKAPDYCFRIGGTRKFFLEAKKPSVNIKEEIHPAYQLRRYAWSAKLPLSILSDFEEFAVYDCRVKPDKGDKAAAARTLYLTYRDYAARWDEIAAVFAREAVLKGSFDQYAESNKAKKGTAEVDTAFLQEIERWRELLARNIALRNPGLGQRDLNYAVQATIDRIIFLRIGEDRGFEPYGRLMALQNGGQVYERLAQLFRQADDRYNSGLFHFKPEKGRDAPDEWTLNLLLDDKPLKDILKNLYYPDSPYEFSVLPADILGQVYEQFLGKVIRLTSGHRAIVEDKPEVKKAGGVYYTPTYIVDYIVRQTVGRLLAGKTPKQVEGLKIADPACGSGSFLIGAYQYLLDWHRDQYLADDPKKWARGRQPRLYQGQGGDWYLTTAERKRLLLDHIYGVDIDAQAVETTKLSLLLKVLEGETAHSLATQLSFLHERVLPDLARNIKCGNSLIGPDFYDARPGQQMSFLLDDEERYRINVFDWEAEFPQIMRSGGFDVVIGNPPYGMVTSEELKNYFDNQFEATEGRFDTYELFIEKGITLCRKQGLLGFIIPSPLLSNLYARKLRKYIIDNCAIQGRFVESCVNCSSPTRESGFYTKFVIPPFTDPTIHTCIIIVKREQTINQLVQIRKQVTEVQQLHDHYDYEIPQSQLGNNEKLTFDIFIDFTFR
jgi:type I restriction-modification system DNA methylase subunit